MKAKVNGIEMHYESQGKEGAPWLVLSHSLACSGRMWDPQLEAFKERYCILNYDMRGHGQSEAPSGARTLTLNSLWSSTGMNSVLTYRAT